MSDPTRPVVTATLTARAMGNAGEFAQMLRPYAAGRLRPVIDRVFPLAQAGEAQRRMDEAGQFGKIVLSIA